MTSTQLLMIRHGESTWNAVRRWQGRADPPLTELGEQQARAAGAATTLHGPFDVVVTSTLQRAALTGELLALTARVELGAQLPTLAERDAGLWEGLTRIEIEEQFPGYLANGRRPTGYEDDDSIVARALAAVDTIARAHPGRRVLVVSHGGVIHALERHVDLHLDSPEDGIDGATWQRLDNLEGRFFEHLDGNLNTVGGRVHLLDQPGNPASVVPRDDSDPHYA